MSCLPSIVCVLAAVSAQTVAFAQTIAAVTDIAPAAAVQISAPVPHLGLPVLGPRSVGSLAPTPGLEGTSSSDRDGVRFA